MSTSKFLKMYTIHLYFRFMLLLVDYSRSGLIVQLELETRAV